MPSGGRIVSVVGTRKSSPGWCAFTCHPGATVTSTTACASATVSVAVTTSSAARAPGASRTRAASRPGAISRRIEADSAEGQHPGGPRLAGRTGRRRFAASRQRNPLDDLEPVARQADQPERVVGEPADLSDTDVAQDLRADPEVAEDARARGEEGRARRRAGAGARDREEVEAAPVAAEIEDDATALGRDPLHRAVQE